MPRTPHLALAALLLASCTTTHGSASLETECPRILGTWVWYIALPEADRVLDADARSDSDTPAKLVAEQSAAAAANEYRGTETFRADGTWIGKTVSGLEIRHRWRLVSESGDRITVTIDMPYADRVNGNADFVTFSEWRREYVVESPDILRDTIGGHDRIQFVRVRRAD